MTTTNHLADQLAAYVTNPEQQKGYLTVPKRLLLQIQAHLADIQNANLQMAIICGNEGHHYQSVPGIGIVCAVCGQPATEDKQPENEHDG